MRGPGIGTSLNTVWSVVRGTRRGTFRADEPPSRHTRIHVLGGSSPLEVVGESHYQENLWRIVGQRPLGRERVRMEVVVALFPELDNHYDSNAVSVWIGDLQVGHLSAEDADVYRGGILAVQQRVAQRVGLHGAIAGGGDRPDGLGLLGVFLQHDPTDFGLPPERVATRQRRIRTGLSDALATDGADDSYDLVWLDLLPQDPVAGVATLRRLLESERDPLDRHFMFHELEATLYRLRSTVPNALSDYDEVCRQHDVEMDDFRAAFMTKWGRVPLLVTYKQMCIRQQKAGQLEQALHWAERGLILYGAEAARPDAVSDLRDRAASYRAKLQPRPRQTRPRPQNAATVESTPETETLVCRRCGRGFHRPRMRGRKPHSCPECSAAADAR